MTQAALPRQVDPNEAFRWAAIRGHTEIVTMLLQDPRVDPAAMDNEAIQRAAIFGHPEVIALLLQDPRVDPAANKNTAIRGAALHGHTEIVELLLQDARVDPAAMNNDAIQRATKYGNTEVVALLLKDPRVKNMDPATRAVVKTAAAPPRSPNGRLVLQNSRVNEAILGAAVAIRIALFMQDSC